MPISTSIAAACSPSTSRAAPACGSTAWRRRAGWLAPGRVLELAGHRVAVVGLEVEGTPLPPDGPGSAPLLTEAATAPLIGVELEPIPAAGRPWTLTSELVVLGRAPACGVPVAGLGVAWVHAVIVRTAAAAYVVNLAGSGLDRNGRPVREAAALAAGDVLGLGPSRFGIRLQLPPEATPGALAIAAPDPLLRRPVELVPPPAELAPPAPRSDVLAWMMGALQTLQAAMLHRQDAFQRELVQALRELHRDQREGLAAHQARVEAIERELAALRGAIRDHLGPATPAAQAAGLPRLPPLQLDAPTPPADPEEATLWLLECMNRLDAANRASWRDLLSRLSPRPDP